jgi:hypothetical protein
VLLPDEHEKVNAKASETLAASAIFERATFILYLLPSLLVKNK